jgi:hypothetical protein
VKKSRQFFMVNILHMNNPPTAEDEANLFIFLPEAVSFYRDAIGDAELISCEKLIAFVTGVSDPFSTQWSTRSSKGVWYRMFETKKYGYVAIEISSTTITFAINISNLIFKMYQTYNAQAPAMSIYYLNEGGMEIETCNRYLLEKLMTPDFLQSKDEFFKLFCQLCHVNDQPMPAIFETSGWTDTVLNDDSLKFTVLAPALEKRIGISFSKTVLGDDVIVAVNELEKISDPISFAEKNAASIFSAVSASVASISDLGRYTTKLATSLIKPAKDLEENLLQMKTKHQDNEELVYELENAAQLSMLVNNRLKPIQDMFEKITLESKITNFTTGNKTLVNDLLPKVFDALSAPYALQGMEAIIKYQSMPKVNVLISPRFVECLLKTTVAAILTSISSGRKLVKASSLDEVQEITEKLNTIDVSMIPSSKIAENGLEIYMSFYSSKVPDLVTDLQIVERLAAYKFYKIPIEYTDLLIFNMIKNADFGIHIKDPVMKTEQWTKEYRKCTVTMTINPKLVQLAA